MEHSDKIARARSVTGVLPLVDCSNWRTSSMSVLRLSIVFGNGRSWDARAMLGAHTADACVAKEGAKRLAMRCKRPGQHPSVALLARNSSTSIQRDEERLFCRFANALRRFQLSNCIP